MLSMLLLWDRIKPARLRLKNPPKKIAAGRKAHEERLFRPDWEFYQRHLQRQVPPALRELYADKDLLTAASLNSTNANRINDFQPLDEAGLVEANPVLNFDIAPIATTDVGDPIYLRPGKTEADTVYITHHDGGDTEVFAESVAAMLGQLRQANPAANA